MDFKRGLINAGALLFLAGGILACSSSNSSVEEIPETNGIAPQAGESALSAALAELQSLDSFRFDFSMVLAIEPAAGAAAPPPASSIGTVISAAVLGDLKSISAEGSFVAPNRLAMNLLLNDQVLDYIQIDKDGWFKYEEGWLSTDAGAALGLGESPFALLSDYLPEIDLAGAATTDETVNGVSATRYSMGMATLKAEAGQFGTRSNVFSDLSAVSVDVWLSDGGIPVRIQMMAEGNNAAEEAMSMTLEMNLSDMNSEVLAVEPPI